MTVLQGHAPFSLILSVRVTRAMAKYTDTQKAVALDLYPEHGTAETARRTNIPARTITRWARAAGLMSQANAEKTATARAKGAEQVAEAWGDFRAAEATGAGTTATQVRDAILAAVEHGGRSREARDLAVTYGILVDKAELLSGNATQRVAVWAEDQVDVELRAMLRDFDEVVNRERTEG